MHRLIQTLKEFGGYYECPKDKQGRRLGPLVGYAGRYQDEKTGKREQFVGDVYADFSVLERKPRECLPYIDELEGKLASFVRPLTFCGMPEGGKALADALACWTNGFYIYPEKKAIALATENSREQSKLVFLRHEVKTGERIFLAEDVMNNFSTTGEAIDLVTTAGGIVLGIIGFLNRLPKPEHNSVFEHKGKEYPIICVLRMPLEEYRQDDPRVADDIARGNVRWKPKAYRQELQELMRKFQK